MKLFRALTVAALAVQAAALSIGGKNMIVERDSDGLQDLVTYDEHSLLVYGERVYVFSGEFHPYRLPVPDLWLDVFQKIKALGFNAVSFYVHWALLEGKPGNYSAEGVFAFEPFFDAAKQAGIYLIARPGPYINAESSGGGFPGWLQRISGQLRTRAPDFLAATDNYMANIGAAIAKAQITNGGPVILVQPENEYTGSDGPVTGDFPDPVYFAYVKKQIRDAGIVVPLINNDASPKGIFAPGSVWQGSTEGDVDIYGHDSYPLGFDCAHPYTWPAGSIPTTFHQTHEQESPSTFYSLDEFQGGSFDPWGGLGFAQCSVLLNMEFQRVFYKNNFASGATLLNLYMIYGGTNWGNLGHPGKLSVFSNVNNFDTIKVVTPVTIMDQASRRIARYTVSPALLTASVGTGTNGTYADSSDIFTTPLLGNGTATNFYVVRHSDYQQTTSSTYKLNLNTSQGVLSIPQLSGSLTLSGRDSKFHVTDYDLGGTTLLYSTAEIFTWKKFNKQTVLVVYGGSGEQHELSVVTSSLAKQVEGTGVTSKSTNATTILNWQTSSDRQVVKVGDLLVYILDRNSAYNYWVPDFVRTDAWGAYTANIGNTTSVIVEAGYLVRSVYTEGTALHIDGDINATVPIKVIGAPANTKDLHFNSVKLDFTTDPVTGEWTSQLKYAEPKIDIPELSSLDWKYLDNLPEIKSTYDDSAWTWLNSTYIGSWAGIDAASANNATYPLPNLSAGKPYIFTVVVDNQGLDENWSVGPDEMKLPRGILNYALSGHAQSDISWKLTGNLGGEDFIDKARGPLNEGGLYAERQGFTQPYPPNHDWVAGAPETGIKSAGVAFYQADFRLDLPMNYDIPLFFNFGNTTLNGSVADYRAQLWVNGWQFGKYVNNIGPQSSFPVPQGILDYHGQNWLAIELWAQQASGAQLTNFTLEAGTPVWTSMKQPELAPRPSYSKRGGAY
ncbi:putative beta-galactosidase A [Lachnellula subtilissima]|uniref:Beta-galactosidase n=1 Tax=Lachnellula subtilissima TaxID=602034 RepID=A0A8H8U4X9_9HELO|nr:putative beta-galactosidase A [Lachnellula subtilissima]